MLRSLPHEQLGPFFQHWLARLIRLQFEMMLDSWDEPQIVAMIAEGCPNGCASTGNSGAKDAC